jgi:hypothetical protein
MPVLLGALYVDAAGLGRGGALLHRSRSFFGPSYVVETRFVRTLRHGRTTHGAQPRAPERANEPGAYYGAHTPFARALRTHGAERPRSIGVVGLGVGSAAAYAREGDSLRFYEIDADVERAARGWFGFLRTTPARTSVVVGDGRVSLARDEGARFDVLVLDAFSSDAVPTHLLTREAFALYLRRLAPDGALLVHVSNRHVAVERVVAGAAADLGLAFALFETPADPSRFAARARWAAVARANDALRGLEGAPTVALPPPLPVLWTDERSSVLSLLAGR